MRLLKEALPNLRGLGPTTRKALGMPLREDEITNGRSNGAMMRCAVMGIAYSPSDAAARRDAVYHLAVATHPDAAAQYTALLLSALFSELYDQPNVDIETVLRDEDAHLRANGFTVEGNWLEEALNYDPPETGTSLDPVHTLGAILHVVKSAPNLPEHFYISCELGGDTDTVAALAAAIGALRHREDSLTEIPWFSNVNWAEVPRLQEFADILETKRGQVGD